jgi:sugar phosphate isomerase/epimerase
VLVVGSVPGALTGNPLSEDIARARAQVYDGIAATLDYARGLAMPVAIEPLRPMQGAERSRINTLSHALDVCDALDPGRAGALGVALDVYHTWWDPELETQIRRAGRERLLAYHACDWLVPTRDLLNDRGMMGDGIVELRKIRGWIRSRGLRRPRGGRDLLRALVGRASRRGSRRLRETVSDRRLSVGKTRLRAASERDRPAMRPALSTARASGT